MNISKEPSGANSRLPFLLVLCVVALVVAIHILWIHNDNLALWNGDAYMYLTANVRFLDNPEATTLLSRVGSLSELSHVGRPPLYQIMTLPFVEMLGRSEDAALTVNVLFLALLAIATYRIGVLASGPWAGFLATLFVVTLPPVVSLSRTYLPQSALPACVALSMALLLSLLKSPRIRTAWGFAASLCFGMWIHPYFLYAFAAPASLGAVLLLTKRLHSARMAAAPRKNLLPALGKDRVLTLGLVPAAISSAAITLGWYATSGTRLLNTFNSVNRPDIELFRGFKYASWGFPEAADSFWWYAQTAPGAVSTVFTLAFLAAFVWCLFCTKGFPRVLAFCFALSFLVMSSVSDHTWMYFSAILPIGAAITAVGVARIRPPTLAMAAGVSLGLIALFNYSFATWGGGPRTTQVAQFLGSPTDSTCAIRKGAAFCPNPAQQVKSGTAEEVIKAILSDPSCTRDAPCSLRTVAFGPILHYPRLTYIANKNPDWSGRVVVRGVGTPTWGYSFNLGGFLQSDYVLYPGSAPIRAVTFDKEVLALLRSPPTSFAEAHETRRKFTSPSGQELVLIARTAPTTFEEADSVLRALDLQEIHTEKARAFVQRLNSTHSER